MRKGSLKCGWLPAQERMQSRGLPLDLAYASKVMHAASKYERPPPSVRSEQGQPRQMDFSCTRKQLRRTRGLKTACRAMSSNVGGCEFQLPDAMPRVHHPGALRPRCYPVFASRITGSRYQLTILRSPSFESARECDVRASMLYYDIALLVHDSIVYYSIVYYSIV